MWHREYYRYQKKYEISDINFLVLKKVVINYLIIIHLMLSKYSIFFIILQMGFVLGLGLAVFVGVGLQFGGRVFSRDVNVLHLISIGIPVCLIYIYMTVFFS